LINLLITGPFFLIWEPKSYQIAQGPNASLVIGKAFCYLAALLCFVYCGLAGASQQIVQVMANKNYFEAYKVVPIVSLAYVFFTLDSVTKIGLLMNKKTKIIMINVLITCSINIGGNFLLIPKWGMMGAAWSTLLAYAALPVINYYFARKYLSLTWQWKRLGLILIVGGVVLTSMIFVHGLSLSASVFVKLGILAMFPLLLFVSGFFNQNEIQFGKDFIGKMRQKLLFKS
jgi:O-antigen/teichoic acid export membrane protein